jgi:hypothetical protein
MRLFEEIEQKKLCNSTTQNIEVTEVTEVTDPKSLGKRGYKIDPHEVTEVTRLSDEDDLFFYLLSDIQSGGAYARLWPNIKAYSRRTLDPQQFSKLLTAYEAKGTDE